MTYRQVTSAAEGPAEQVGAFGYLTFNQKLSLAAPKCAPTFKCAHTEPVLDPGLQYLVYVMKEAEIDSRVTLRLAVTCVQLKPLRKRSQSCPAKLFSFVCENEPMTVMGQNRGGWTKVPAGPGPPPTERDESARCRQPVERGLAI